MPVRACDNCGQMEGQGVELRRCGRCRRALYCCRPCQKADWPQHKQACCRQVLGGRGGLQMRLPEGTFQDAEVRDLAEPAPGEWRFGRPMQLPRLDLPFPLTRKRFEASLPQLLELVEHLYNVGLTCGGTTSAECSPPHGIFLYGLRKGERDPMSKEGRTAAKDETRLYISCFMTTDPAVVQSGKDKERFASRAMQDGIDACRAQAALFMQEERLRRNMGGVFRVTFEGVVVTALAPGVRRCFELDMLPGGRRDGRLVHAEPAVETGMELGTVFLSKHPRFHPAP